MRIADFLADQHVSCEFLLHPPAFTAQKRAKYMHLSGAQVGKCVLLRGPSGYLLAVLPATHHVNLEALTQAMGGPVRLAGSGELAEVFRDCEWGVAPPFGRLYGLDTLLEASIPADACLVFETHTHTEAVRIRCADFELLEQPRRLHFAQSPG